MLKSIFTFVFSFLFSIALFAQGNKDQSQVGASPKLILGIVVDQMRYDYMYRFATHYSEGGFKRLMREGYFCENTHYNYTPTYTAPGHASIYTGTAPDVNGIIGNNWYERTENKLVYCVSDPGKRSIGSESNEGKMSPHRLLSTTIGDELKLDNRGASKVFAISMKDRGSILPGGHSADAAYWYDGMSGKMISSSYYMDKLPQWMDKFNDRKLPDQYLNQKWETLMPLEKYTESNQDDSPYEEGFGGAKPVFPYDLKQLRGNDFSLLRTTPFGSKLMRELAMDLIKSENLGKGKYPDMLALSFSAPDYIGHKFGISSIELEDSYLHLDKEIEALLEFLDGWVGKENVLVFLTSDHGVGYNPQYLMDRKIPGGFFNEKAMADTVNSWLNVKYGPKKWLLSFYNLQFYLDHKLIIESGYRVEEFEDFISSLIRFYPGVSTVIKGSDIRSTSFSMPPLKLMQHGYNHVRSGDVIVTLQPGWMEWSKKTGTTHGSSYAYDTHVPLLWYGWKIKHGSDSKRVDITDIAPTISSLLKISLPSGSTGQPLTLPLR